VTREPAVVACYVDTSALLKRYVGEAGSDAFDAFCGVPEVDRVISPLVATEFTGVLQRRVRTGALTRRQANTVHHSFLSDVAAGGWSTIEFGPDIFSSASQLMLHLAAPLATLDALHLAAALQHGATELATADRQLAVAAREARLHVHLF
jgi:predicted nucleic acid-binding protein